LENGDLLAVAGTHLFIVDRKTFIAKTIPYKVPAGSSRSAIQDGKKRIWLGTSAGLTCFDTSFHQLFSIRDSLTDGRVASLCEWKPDHMLIGTRGLYEVKVQDNKIISFSQKKSIPAEQLIYCMQQDRQGYVWLGTDDGIFRYDAKKDEAVRFDATEGVQSQAFNSNGVLLSRSGIMYMGGKNGLNYFRPDAYIAPTELLKPFVLSFSVSIGDSIYNRLPKQIPYYSRNLDFIISAPELIKPFRLQYRYRLRSTDAWTLTGSNNHIRISNLPSGDYNLQVATSYDGKQWFNGSELFSFSVLKPWWQTWWFRIVCVAIIVFTLWRWNIYRRRRREAVEIKKLMEYFRYANSADASVEMILWDIARNCISQLGFEDCVIYLLDEERNVLVQKAAYGDKNPASYFIANPIEIPVGKGITGVVAQNGEALIIPDTRKDSRYIVDNASRLSELAVPLVHDGRVIGVIDSEHSKKNFFTTHHLKALQTVASLCSSKIATAMAMEAMRKAENELQLLDGKMTEAKFTNLRLQMNPHFLFNILTTIQYLIVSNQVTKATKYLDIFSGFLRSLLDHAENSVVTLEEELRILKLYVELESLCLDETFEWSIHVAQSIDAEDVLVPFMLLQPFVENAIHHGLMHKPGVKKFTIHIEEDAEASLHCTIEDNGIGRKASANINGRSFSGVVHQSKGISIVEKRLQLLQQKTGKQACFSIEDLLHNGTANGTRVHITIPNYLTADV
jgi:putative methionine-R-sulfoxide reductase with GAF domain